jgi:hypothetical protein
MSRNKTDTTTQRAKIDKYKRVPEGERVLVSLPLSYKQKKADGTVVTLQKSIVKLKEGTAKQFNLTVLPDTELAERPNAGAKGTKSFKVVLEDRVTIGGAEVKTLSVPVPGGVKVSEFFKWAKTLPKAVAIITPGGRKLGFKIDVTDDVDGPLPDNKV